MKNLSSISVMAFILSFALAACGNNFNAAKLPDEPGQEQTVEGLPSDEATPDTQAETDTATTVTEPAPTASAPASDTNAILEKYDHLDPKHIVPTKALQAAVLFYDANASKIKNKNYLSIINFGQNSREKRFYIVNMKSGEVLAIHTSHGKGSDSNHDGMAERFSNTSGSNASSLGYYLTAETYYGKHGLSLRLDGLSSTNSNARARAVVIHGASYVQESNVIQGRSFGCPAVSMDLRDKVVGILKGGSLIYAVK